MNWQSLFGRAAAVDADEADVSEALARVRGRTESDGYTERDANRNDDAAESAAPAPPEPSPARVVADADVLAADLLVGGRSRAALEALWRHSWTTLVASDALLDDAEAVVADLAEPTDASLAADWRAAVADWREPVSHPRNDHPALGSAYRGGAMHVLSLDDRLTSAGAGAALRDRVPVSVREPRAFAAVFDAERLYPEVRDGDYPGPDREPRDGNGESAP
ncbi:DUF7384 family protein [Haloparvum sedimenti]|uniref:DUF7384 family protein n=1 Tax=Haloparvum sedimenti TaxID=1678448 RepID=UPI00071E841E|nr:hypothetical protein [Haloparvum sedimenti]